MFDDLVLVTLTGFIVFILFSFCTDNVTVYKNLSGCDRHMKVYLKDALPDRLHYKNNERTQPIILVADEGWTIVKDGSLPRCECFLKQITNIKQIPRNDVICFCINTVRL